ncbi:MAG: ABC transporter substrate-binding protein [Nitrospira sp.]
MTLIDATVRTGRRPARFAYLLVLLPVAALTILGGLVSVEATESELTPTDTIASTIDELFSILKEQQGPALFHERRREIERVIRRDVHYEEMAKRSLGSPWGQMDDQGRREYVDLFVRLLRDALANRMIQYQDEKILYLSERRQATCAEVRTRLVGSKVDTVLDFRLTYDDGRWLVYDAVMDGTSIVGTYRAQFATIIRDESMTELLNKLKANTVLVKLFDTHGS